MAYERRYRDRKGLIDLIITLDNIFNGTLALLSTELAALSVLVWVQVLVHTSFLAQ